MPYKYLKTIFFFIVFNSFTITAQTTGPSQPEVQSFQPASVTNMVETSTGEFQYNIPLFTIGDYPVNINYNSQVGMENEASMVGLGFNLNCGAITRQVRGLPDDFKGDIVIKRVNMKPNITTGIDLGVALELVGFDKEAAKKAGKQIGLNISSNAGLFYNNYTGWGVENRVGAGFSGNKAGLSGNAGIGINSNSQHGTDVNPYVGLSYEYKKANDKNKEEEKTENKKFDIKNTKIKTKFGAGAGYDFNSISYTPKIDFPFTSTSVDFTFKAGYGGAYFEIGGEIRGYRVVQKLQTNQIDNPAYGFLFADSGKNDEGALMDFNRQNDGIMTEDKRNLPFAYATPDVYSVAGQGIGGVFEIKRNNIFIGFDPKTKTNTHNGGTEMELGFGTGAHIGAQLRYGYVLNTSEKWNANSNKILGNTDFMSVLNSSLGNNAVAEQVYFKNPSDVMFNDNPSFNLTGDKPLAATLNHAPYFGGKTKLDKLNSDGQILNINSLSLVNQKRDNRLDVVYYLNAKEAGLFGIQKEIPNYTMNNFTPAGRSSIPRVDANRKEHHLSEMTSLKADGTRYVFNIPAYNNSKQEVSYSVNESDIQNYETTVIPSLSPVSNTGKGRDDFISVTETPAYAHSFLLGCVLAANYIDVDDNGPSVNDLGDYVKFNYSRKYSDFNWRSNNNKDKASADAGNLADSNDGRASFTKGNKEVWYIHSIESKKEVSRFYYSPRSDAKDIENGRLLMKLDSIVVYSRPELNYANPKPLKRIYMDYNTANPLCKGVYGNPALGKLTLNSIYFKDGSSNKGKFSAYKFGYSNFNPNYNTLEVDRWGNYKPNTNSSIGLALDNKEFPFVKQDSKTAADTNAKAWLLSKIELPSGGIIDVNYEANDYAYVQNKRAMYMTKVIGVSDASMLALGGNTLYSGTTSYNNLLFQLKAPIAATMSQSDADALVKKDYFTDPLDTEYGNIIYSGGVNHANLYGKFRVSLKPDLGFNDEDVPVFLDSKRCGAVKINGVYYGYVELNNTNTGSSAANDANQISKTAWQFVKHSYSQILFGMDADPSLSTSESMQAVAGMLSPATNTIKSILQIGPYKKLRNMNVAKTISLDHSYIRVYEPSAIKLGGNGARVKSIQINDNWNAMNGNTAGAASYTIHYDYTKTINNKTVSSGVASYEPEQGGEENPWKQPIFFQGKNKLMPDDNHFMMMPYGESLFPGANIVYSEVKITQNPVSSPTQVGAGYTKNKYYTYFDFPCKVANTDIEIVRDPKVNFKLLNNISNDYMVSTQGYAVTTNDMQGKPKSEEAFGEGGNLVTGKYYKYKTSSEHELSNTVKSINRDGTIVNDDLLGVETQVYGDAQRFHTESYSGSVHGNLDIQVWGVVPTVAPSIWPDFSFEKKTFSSFTLCKHTRRQGILESVTAVDKGASVTTKNELWDAKTGAVLLTSATNEFKDPIYSFTYPAHWAYPGMGMASDNILAMDVISGSSFSLPFMSKLVPGDIIAISNGSGVRKAVFESSVPLSMQPLYSTGATGSASGSVTAKVIASGKKNLATVTIGSFTSLVNPIQGNQLVINANTKIINATATEYGNPALRKCTTCENGKGSENAYLVNSTQYIAPWQALANYKFVDDRNQTNGNPNLRKDGFIDNFAPFWITNTWSKTMYPKWQFTEKASVIDSDFNLTQSFNPLQIFSSSQPSNFSGLVNAGTTNAKYHENLFDGFEDAVPECRTQHYSILNAENAMMLDPNQAHTGNFSMKTGAASFTKNFIYDTGVSSGNGETKFSYSCAEKFTLLPNKKYILSAWVKDQHNDNITLDYNNAQISVNFNAGLNVVCKPSGQIIDGWQRIETTFTAPPGNTTFSLLFSERTNFDDIRIFPADANMKSYVYSYRDYSLMAILDENNFATFYEYDSQKQLRRIKKETEKGVVTVEEVNYSSYKK